jgi:hydrogenase nickel incorporation protein HypB
MAIQLPYPVHFMLYSILSDYFAVYTTGRKELTMGNENEAVKILEIKRSVFASNDEAAGELRKELKEKGVFLLNLMSSPGSGKTTTLMQTIAALKDEFKIGVMEADIDSDIDARTIASSGVKSIQLHTGGMCHLDAGMTRQGLEGLETGDVNLAILENVGNLVCPAEFDTGAAKNAMILSVPEGHDKPLKYPLMFSVCDVVLINKIDVMPYFDFDLEKCREYIHLRNPRAVVIPISARTGEGIDAWADWLRQEVREWING